MDRQSSFQQSRSRPAWASLTLTAALLALSLVLLAGLVHAQDGSAGRADARAAERVARPQGPPMGVMQQGWTAAPEGDQVWTPLGGPSVVGGETNDLAVEPGASDIVYAAVGVPGDGSATVVYKSSDGAASWTPVYTSTAYRLSAVAVTGTLVYGAGQGDHGHDIIVRSDDAGASWTTVFTGMQDYQNDFRALAIDPQAPTTVYAAGRDWWHAGQMELSVVYRTDDGGLAWTPMLTVPGGCCGASFNAVAIDPAAPATVYAAGRQSENHGYGTIYRSTDSGDTWTEVFTSGPPEEADQFTSLLVHPNTPNIVYAGSGWGLNHVYRSTDSGDTWTRVLTDAGGIELAFEAPDTVYAAAEWGGMFRSMSGGDPGTWEYVGGTSDGIRSLALDGTSTPSALYAGHHNQGVSKSDDGGSTWELRNNGIQTLVLPCDIDVDPQDPEKILATAECASGWMSTDGGESWTEPQGIAGCMGTFAINPDNPDIVYGGAYDCSRGAVLRSENGGLDFEPVYTATFIITDCSGGGEQIHALALAASMTDTVYAAGSDEFPEVSQAVIVRSLDDGTSWTEVFTLPGHSRVKALAIDPTNDNVVYAGGEDCHTGPCEGFVYRTTDAGDTWEQTLVTSNTVGSIAVDYQKPDVLYAATRGPYDVYKSTDGGDTWTLIRSNNPPFEQASGYLLTIDPHVPSHVYLGGWGYIAETFDGGVTWIDSPINDGTPPMEPRALTVDYETMTQTLYAGFTGAWSYSRPAPQPGEPATITMWTEPISGVVYANGEEFAGFRALVVDQYENWVANGTPLTVTYAWALGDDEGEIDFLKATDNGGIQGGWIGSSAGVYTFTARTANLVMASVSVQMLYNSPAGISVDAAPDSIGAGGATAMVTATVPGLHGGIASDGTEVTFETSLGTIDASALTFLGVATATLTSGNEAGTAVITARADGFEDTTTVEITGFYVYLPLVVKDK